MTALGSMESWPRATLDGVAMVEVVARATGDVPVVHRVVDAPFERVWAWLADVEVSIPAFDRTVKRVRVLERRANVLRMSVRTRWLPPMRFNCHVGDAHVMMAAPARSYCVGLGVRRLGPDRTLVAQFETIPRRGARLFGRLRVRHVERDLGALQALVEQLDDPT